MDIDELLQKNLGIAPPTAAPAEPLAPPTPVAESFASPKPSADVTPAPGPDIDSVITNNIGEIKPGVVPAPESPGLLGQVPIGAKLGMRNAVVTAARAFDPGSVLSGLGIDPNAPERAMANVPATREERAKVAEKGMTEAMFPRGVPEAKGLGEEVVRGLSESWPTLAALFLTGGFGAGAVLGPEGLAVAPAAEAIGAAAIPFGIMGLTEEDPLAGAAKGAVLGTTLGGMHLATKGIEKPLYQWLAKIGGGAGIGGGATAVAGGGPEEISRDAIIFGIFEAFGMPTQKPRPPLPGERFSPWPGIDQRINSLQGKISDQALTALKEAPTNSPEFIGAVEETAKALKPESEVRGQEAPVAPPVAEAPTPELPPALTGAKPGAPPEVVPAPPEAPTYEVKKTGAKTWTITGTDLSFSTEAAANDILGKITGAPPEAPAAPPEEAPRRPEVSPLPIGGSASEALGAKKPAEKTPTSTPPEAPIVEPAPSEKAVSGPAVYEEDGWFKIPGDDRVFADQAEAEAAAAQKVAAAPTPLVEMLTGKKPEPPAPPVTVAGAAAETVATPAPEPKPSAVPEGVQAFNEKYGTARGVGKPEGLLTEGIAPGLEGAGFRPASREAGSLSGYSQFPRERINLKPEVFQHKREADLTTGAGGALEDAKWNEARAGEMALFENLDGSFDLAHGHNRLWLADQDKIPTVKVKVYREADGWTPPLVKMEAFLDNLADGKLDSLDIGQFLRETGATEADLKGRISLKSKDAQTGIGLSRLTPRIWDDVYRGVWGTLPEKNADVFGAIVGKGLAGNPAAQESLYQRIIERQTEGKTTTPAELRYLVDSGRMAIVSEESQVNLFGEETVQKSRMFERATLASFIEKELSDNKNALAYANREKARLQEAGNVINEEANRRISIEAKEVLNVFSKVSKTEGMATYDYLNEMAERLAQAKNRGEEDAIKREALAGLNRALSKDFEALNQPAKLRIGPEGGGVAAGEVSGIPGGQEIPPEDLGPSLFSLKDLDLAAQTRPLSKFELRLKAIQEEFPEADPERAAMMLRGNPRATNEQIALLSRVSKDVSDKMNAATTAAMVRGKERPGAVQAGLFGEAPPGGAGGLFAEPAPRGVPGRREPVAPDTMVEAIALSSPSGKMSNRVRAAAQERIRTELFGEEGLARPMIPQPEKAEILLRQAEELRGLADRGMKPRAYLKKAQELEAEAARLKEQTNATEQRSTPAGATGEPEVRPGGVPEVGEGRAGELADFQSRIREGVVGDGSDIEIAFWGSLDLKPPSEEFHRSPTVEGIRAKATARGIERVILVADAPFESVLVPDQGKRTLVVAESVTRGTHKELADHEFFHRDLESGDPKAQRFVDHVNVESQAFADYGKTINRIRESAGLPALTEEGIAGEIAADASSGLTRRRQGDGKEIDLREAFHEFDKARDALVEYRGKEGLPGRMEQMEAQVRARPPNYTLRTQVAAAHASQFRSRMETAGLSYLLDMSKPDAMAEIAKLKEYWDGQKATWDTKPRSTGNMDYIAEGNKIRNWQMRLKEATTQINRYVKNEMARDKDELSHLRTAEEITGKVGGRTLKQETLFSLKPDEERQGFVVTGEPMMGQKEFEAELLRNQGALEKMLREPGSRLIPLYEGESYIGSRAGDKIKDARGRLLEITPADLYERFFKPTKPQLPAGTQTSRPEDFIGKPGEPAAAGVVEEPPSGYFGKLLRSVREKFSAANISEKANLSQIFLVKNMSWMRREMAKAVKVLDPFNDRFAKMSQEEMLRFTDMAESNSLAELTRMAFDPASAFDVSMLQAASAWRRLADGLHFLRSHINESLQEEARAAGKPVPDLETAYWENYFPRLFKNPEDAAAKIQALLKSRGRSLTGPESFENPRSQLLFSDSIKPVEEGGLGLEPMDGNYINMMKANIWEQLRFLTGKYIEGDLKEAGFLSNKKMTGWEKLKGDKTLEGYYAHPDVARVLANFMSKGLRGDPMFELYNSPVTFINTVLVGMSAFHATFSVFSDLAHGVGSNLTRGVGAALNGRFSLAGHHMAELAKSAAIPLNLIQGGKFIEEYETPGTHGGEKYGETGTIGKIVDLMSKGGIAVNAQELSQVNRAFSEVLRDDKLGVPRKVVELIAWPIMSYMVPRIKLNATARLLQMELDAAAREGRILTEQQQIQLAQDVVRKSDNIFGQMVYDNLSMTRGLRDAMRLLIGFPGWNIGSFTDILQAGKGIVHGVGEAGKAGAELLTGRTPTWENMSRQNRMSLEFYLGTVLTMAVFGAITQRLLTGNWPGDSKDLLMPQTGALMANGQPERIRPPTYMRDVLSLSHPVEMAKHKLNFPLRMFSALTDNQDFFGEQIRDPYAKLTTQIGQTAKYIGKSLLPFGIQGYMATESKQAKAMNLIGVTKVPRIYSNTPAMNVMDDYNKQNRAAMTSKQAGEEKRLKGELRKLAGEKDEKGFQLAAATAMKEGVLTRQQIKALVDESREPTPGLGRFKALPVEWQVRAWDVASPGEKAAWKPQFLKKVMAAKPEILIRNKEALVPVLQEMGLGRAAKMVETLAISEKATKFDLSSLGIRKPEGKMGSQAAIDSALSETIKEHLDKLGEEKTPKGFKRVSLKEKKRPYSALGF